jgi:hypothetical protein
MTELSQLPGKAIFKFMAERQFRISALNLVYLIGASADDWKPLTNTMDSWNDVRIVVKDSGEVLGSWTATSDPGTYYEKNPMNPDGCALLALGQHRDGWQRGTMHEGRYPALVQTGNPIAIYRDRAGDGGRYGHVQIVEDIGICHHGCNGGDGGDSIGRWSAGCQVGRYWSSHLSFMQLMKDSGRDTFDATLIDRNALNSYL